MDMHPTFMRLADALKLAKNADHHLTMKEIAELMSESAQTVTNWKTRGVSQAGIVNANAKFGIQARYIDRGVGQPLQPPTKQFPEPLDVPTFSRSKPEPSPLQEVGAIHLGQRVPVIGMAKLGENGYYDEISDIPGMGDGYIEAHSSDPNAYALRVRGDSMFPAIRDGWYVVVEPNGRVVPGEYVLIKLRNGQKMVKELIMQREDSITVVSVNGEKRRTIMADEIEHQRGLQPIAAILSPSKWRPE